MTEAQGSGFAGFVLGSWDFRFRIVVSRFRVSGVPQNHLGRKVPWLAEAGVEGWRMSQKPLTRMTA